MQSHILNDDPNYKPAFYLCILELDHVVKGDCVLCTNAMPDDGQSLCFWSHTRQLWCTKGKVFITLGTIIVTASVFILPYTWITSTTTLCCILDCYRLNGEKLKLVQ